MSDYLPEDVVNKILLRLPVKTLMRCRVVCQSWNNLIQSSTFINTHLRLKLQLNSEKDVHLLLLQSWLSWTDVDSPPVYSLHWSDPELSEYANFITPTHNLSTDLVGTYNGLVCLSTCFSTTSGFITVWNPSIRRYLLSSVPLCCFDGDESYGFGYDSQNNDYKVLLLANTLADDKSTVPVGMVWSFASGAWTSLSSESLKSLDLYEPFLDGLASVNSALHWLQYEWIDLTTDEDNYKISMVSFDLVTETFSIQEALMVKDTPSSLKIMRYEETLALFEYRSHESEEFCDLWVMKEYGVQCWTKIVTVRHGLDLDPFGFKNSREIVIGLEDERGQLVLKSMNIDSKEVNQFGRNGHVYYFMDTFIESLVLLDHPYAVSY